METSFRPLLTNERQILERLLEPRFPGRDELRAQLQVATAKTFDEDGCFDIQCSQPVSPAPVKSPIPTEGECADRDGATLHVQLHVVGGIMKCLEMYKEDGSAPLGLPDARSLKLFAAHSEDAGVWTRSEKFR
jgi:hypothetical protein